MVMAGSLNLSQQGVNSEQIKNNIILVSVKLGELCITISILFWSVKIICCPHQVVSPSSTSK